MLYSAIRDQRRLPVFSKSVLSKSDNFKIIKFIVISILEFHSVLCPKQGSRIKGDILHAWGVCCTFFCPKQGQGFKPAGVPLYPKIGQVSPKKGELKLGRVCVNPLVLAWCLLLHACEVMYANSTYSACAPSRYKAVYHHNLRSSYIFPTILAKHVQKA